MKLLSRLLFCLAAGLLLLAACARQGPAPAVTLTPTRPAPTQAAVTAPPSHTPPATAVPDATATAAAGRLAGLRLRFWHAWTGAARQSIEAWTASFNQTNPWKIQVEAVAYSDWDHLYQAVSAGLASQESPDLVTAYLSQALTWGTNRLVDLEAYRQDPSFGLAPGVAEEMLPVFTASEGSAAQYGIGVQSHAQVLLYNQSWAQELGYLQAPATPEQFQAQVCAAARVNANGRGGWVVDTQPNALLGWMQAFGGQVVEKNSTASGEDAAYLFDTPPVHQAFSFLRGLYDQGCAWLSASQPPAAEFATRQALVVSASVSEIPYYASAFQQAGNTDQWIALPYPSPMGKPVAPVYGPKLVILRSNPDRQLAAWLFLRELFFNPASAVERQQQLAEATGALPVLQAAYAGLEAYRQAYPAWGSAAGFVPGLARPEPALASWQLVRWAVFDAGTQLFRSYFKIEQAPDLAHLLQQTAADLQNNPQVDRINLSPTATAP